jgi:hypothetical protein
MSLNFFRKIFNLDLTKKASRKGVSRRLELLGLEERVVPATFTVVNNSDSGAGSLRQAIIDANATAANDIIDFNFATSSSPYTITLTTALDSIADASAAGTLTITGLGASSLIIDANKGNFSIFTIDSNADLTISGVTVTGANTTGSGGAFNNSGTLSISNSTLSGNTATSNGGAIDNSGILSISNSTLSGNTAVSGGGILNVGTLTVSNSTISSNKANYGGGIKNAGTLTISNSTLSGNSATTGQGIGAGIFNEASGILTVSNSTLSGNSAVGNGGGIYNDSGIFSIINSTLSGNSAGNSGGGITSQGTGIGTLTNSTLSGNSATVFGGGFYNQSTQVPGGPGATLNIANTIIANSTSGGDYAGGGTGGTNTNNLVQDGSLSGAIIGDPLLGTLANNGGPTLTMALLTGCPAIGTGNPAISNAAPVNGLDQRGVTRSSTTPSIGA